MRVLMVHNYYQQDGGEDVEFQQEVDLLRSHGDEVFESTDTNRRIGASPRVSVGLQTIWSWQAYAAISNQVKAVRPDVLHFHNTFPLISPSGYYVGRAMGVPVVQSLYNPRLLCPAASFFRDGRLCTDCLGRIPYPAVVHACYQGSRSRTLAVASMITLHRGIGTWNHLVAKYLVATRFYSDLFIEKGGLPGHKLAIKPDFVANDPGEGKGALEGEYALFVGRLDPEKGVRTLLKAWHKLDIPLVIRGNGRLEAEVIQFLQDHGLGHVRIVGRLTNDELMKVVRRARFLVWPSEGYYETFGLVAAESFAAGVPVIASRIGVMTEMVRDGETGLHFTEGDAEDLAAKCLWLWNHPEESARMGRNARREYEQKYTPARNYELLMSVYADVTKGAAA